MSALQQVARRPRKWLVAWTYKRGNQAIAKELEGEVMVRFPRELLEVFVSDAISGYIFLRVTKLSPECKSAVSLISGVGGISCLGNKRPLEAVELSGIRLFGEMITVEEGDLVKVTMGPLKGHVGRVVRRNHPNVKIELDVFGRLISVDFQQNEVSVCRRVSQNGRSGS